MDRDVPQRAPLGRLTRGTEPDLPVRLWSVHPRYLDARGLVALWREALLARAVIRGRTRGYRRHPQLDRFRAQLAPRSAINAYLRAIHDESARRGYRFDSKKCGPGRDCAAIPVTRGQLRHEWNHLLAKLRARSPGDYLRCKAVRRPAAHPMFRIVGGPVEKWERLA